MAFTAQDFTNQNSQLGQYAQYGRDNNIPIQQLSRGAAAGAFMRGADQLNQEGDYQKYIADLLKRLRTRNYNVQGQRAANQTTAQYGAASRMADQQARSAGLGQGAQLGMQQGLSQNAARAGASAQQAYLDPSRRDNDLMQALGLQGNYLSSNPYADQLGNYNQQLLGIQQTNNAQPRRGTFLDTVGGLAGSLAGGGAFKGLFK